MTITCVVVLFVWFLLSAMMQMNLRFMTSFKKCDLFSLIPNWKLFAPRPGTSDYHLVYRHFDLQNRWSQWQEIPIDHNEHFWRVMWNPEKRLVKMLSDVVREGSQLAQKMGLNALLHSLPYLAVLNHVSCLPELTLSRKAQFMILKTEGLFNDEEPQLVFLSAVHDLHSFQATPLQSV